MSKDQFERHFSPPYYPWQRRICLTPAGDFFGAIRYGNSWTSFQRKFQAKSKEIPDNRSKLNANLHCRNGKACMFTGHIDHMTEKGIQMKGLSGSSSQPWIISSEILISYRKDKVRLPR